MPCARAGLPGSWYAALELRVSQVAERLGDLTLVLVTAMEIDQRGTGGRMPNAVHQLPQCGSKCQPRVVTGMAQIVEMKLTEPGAGPRNGVGRRVRRG